MQKTQESIPNDICENTSDLIIEVDKYRRISEVIIWTN
jgi:hypothetical protein